MSKKLALTETELATKSDLNEQYEHKFVQVREAVESEKERHARVVSELNDTIQGKEKELAKMEEKVKAMGEERAGLLSK